MRRGATGRALNDLGRMWQLVMSNAIDTLRGARKQQWGLAWVVC